MSALVSTFWMMLVDAKYFGSNIASTKPAPSVDTQIGTVER